MNVALLLLVFAGVIFVLANELVAARREPRVVYRYLPRDLDAFLRQEPYASTTFNSMFNEDDIPTGR